MRALPEHIDIEDRRLRWRCAAPCIVGAGDGFALDDESRGWLIVAGAVDVFIAGVEEGVSGARRHLLRAQAGSVLFGVDGGDATVRWIAVPLADTMLAGFDRAVAAADPAFVPAFDAWAGDVVAAFALTPHLDDAQPLSAGRKFVPDRALVSGAAGVRWGKVDGGGVVQVDTATGAANLGPGPWPLDLTLAYRVPAACEITICEDAAEFGAAEFDGAIAAIARLAALHHADQAAREADAQAERLARRLNLDAKLVAGANDALSNLLSSRPACATAPDQDDPLVKAIAFLAARENITFRPPVHAGAATMPTQARLEQLLLVAGLMWRRARLDHEWAGGEAGTFLALDRESDAPYVVFADWRSRVFVYDPVRDRSERLCPQRAARFGDWVIAIGRPLPATPLKDGALLRFGLAGQRADIIAMICVGLLAGLIGLLTPIISSTVFGEIIPDAETQQLFQYGGLLAGMTLAVGFFNYVQAISTTRLSGRLDNSLQTAVLDRLLRLPVSFFRDYTAGDLTSRAMGINTINSTLATVTLTSILTGLFASLNLILMFWYEWRLALIGVAIAVLTFFATLAFSIRQLVWQRRGTDMQGRQTGLALQLIGGVHKLRAANAEDRAYAIWATGYAEQNDLNLRAQRWSATLAVFNTVIPSVGVIIIFIAIAWLLGTISISKLIAFNAAFGQFFAGATGLSAAVSSVVSIWPLYRRVKPILAAAPEVDETKADPGLLRGRIAIDHVTFSYDRDERPTLDDVSLTVEPGEFVALVGPSGSGKSTLARLMIGFEQPRRGTIFLDDKDLSALDLHAVRRQLGVVVQNCQVMPGNIFQNIVGNNAELTADDAWEAAELAGLADDLRAMPMKLETFISESGGNFSAGQRQRLMLARAIAMRPRILILDEATSALDNKTQAHVARNLARLNVTRIVIAQRLSTIVDADRIIVLANGRIRQQGNLEGLMQEPGLFRDFIARQMQ